MLDIDRIYHTGFAVPDLAAAQAMFTKALGVRWAPVHVYDPLRLWRPNIGWTEEYLRVSYSRPGPHQIEVIETPKKGSFYDPARPQDNRHIGLWVDDVGGEVERLLAEGWQLLCAKGSPEERYGNMSYMRHPSFGPVLELVSVEMQARLLAWFNEPDPA
jgi:catechol 2,3-dioxygenase-like lactoylglutathione lyase family enzyme